MRKFAVALLIALLPGIALGAEGGQHLMNPDVDVSNTASLQRGAKYFANYCMGCHSLKYLRYSRMAEDLNIPEDVVEKTMIWDGGQVHSKMMSAMASDDGKNWFGAAPPDLSLTVRARGADWVYTYLNTFYRDPESDTGVNNLTLPGASMPHVLWQLQGMPEPVYGEGSGGSLHVKEVEVPEGAGLLSEEEYHQVTRDITNFLAYAAEPVQAERERLGVWVLLFIAVFTALAYLLKREFWKDVH
ncbi:Ammonia monooxygenase gamma subunit [wastewater metagenome]|uniref:Ammonia monooxygenase gamma subunit n=2 Tax=unclassified sequences TaxID=12908 RepID=A0A5B8RA91_9ZZZZ|nr:MULTISPECIES: cytochrome c1 [Arhodomonas]MCS4504720.1 cytochrome c1 [Arhodomonas aquaeolei]QEA04963.1 ammonia monooxygenase gamma subunit [uncultured organism]